MIDLQLERSLRAALFAFLTKLRARTGGPVTYAQLAEFTYDDESVPLFSRPRGIHKPKLLGQDGAALTILTTAPKPGGARPYDDEAAADEGYWIYKYQGEDVEASDNRLVRRAMRAQLPLVYFIGIEKGAYEAFYPVFVTYDDPARLSFHLAADTADGLLVSAPEVSDTAAARRYATRAAKVRLHQAQFRIKVLKAYVQRCTICRIRHLPLLDAAHITADSAENGTPDVTNGLALCKIHHAAFDAQLLGVSPDYTVVINSALLDEVDGPMLQHGLKEMHNHSIHLPARQEQWPSQNRLAERFQSFVSK